MFSKSWAEKAPRSAAEDGIEELAVASDETEAPLSDKIPSSF